MKLAAGALFAVLLAACTTYDQGVGSYWRGPNILVVSGAGNGFTSAQAVTDYVYLQAADKALETGYSYFVLASQADTSTVTQGTIYTPTTTNYSGYTYGNTFSGTATTTGGAQNFPIFKPGLDAMFVMYDGPPPGYRSGQYFSAVAVHNALGPKYLGKKFHPAVERVAPVAPAAARVSIQRDGVPVSPVN
jgi:hypothetical protein